MTGPEIHFAEGFTDESAEIHFGDKVVRVDALNTRFQIGLAHIEPLLLEDGEGVTIEISDGQRLLVQFDAQKPFIVLSLQDGRLTAEIKEQRPGYV